MQGFEKKTLAEVTSLGGVVCDGSDLEGIDLKDCVLGSPAFEICSDGGKGVGRNERGMKKDSMAALVT